MRCPVCGRAAPGGHACSTVPPAVPVTPVKPRTLREQFEAERAERRNRDLLGVQFFALGVEVGLTADPAGNVVAIVFFAVLGIVATIARYMWPGYGVRRPS